MYMVAKICYSKQNAKNITTIKPIYTNISNTEEASYLAQLAIMNNDDKSNNSIIVIIPNNNPNINMNTMSILDKIYKERGDKHE